MRSRKRRDGPSFGRIWRRSRKVASANPTPGQGTSSKLAGSVRTSLLILATIARPRTSIQRSALSSAVMCVSDCEIHFRWTHKLLRLQPTQRRCGEMADATDLKTRSSVVLPDVGVVTFLLRRSFRLARGANCERPRRVGARSIEFTRTATHSRTRPNEFQHAKKRFDGLPSVRVG